MHKNWRIFVPGHVWHLVLTIGYAIFCFAFYRARSWGIRNGVVICIAEKPMLGNPGAQTVGGTTCFANAMEIQRTDLHVHENVHIVESMLCGIGGAILTPVAFAALDWSPAWGLALGGFVGAAAYAVSYGLFFFVAWAASGFGHWHDAYHKNPWEKLAYAKQDEYVRGNEEQRAQVWS